MSTRDESEGVGVAGDQHDVRRSQQPRETDDDEEKQQSHARSTSPTRSRSHTREYDAASESEQERHRVDDEETQQRPDNQPLLATNSHPSTRRSRSQPRHLPPYTQPSLMPRRIGAQDTEEESGKHWNGMRGSNGNGTGERPHRRRKGGKPSAASDDKQPNGCFGLLSCFDPLLGAGSSVLILFTICQWLIFYDRGMVAGFLPAIQESVGGLGDTQMGLLGSGFIFGYMLACPMFAFASRTYSPYKLMSIGLFLWVNAVVLCGVTNDFLTLLGARILTGVGEASFAGLAPTCIDDVAPPIHRTIWLSIFFSGIPLGGACGYIAGGWFAKVGWQIGFVTEATAMLPLVLIVFFWPNPTAPTGGKRRKHIDANAGRAVQQPRQYMARTNSWVRLPRDTDEMGPRVSPHMDEAQTADLHGVDEEHGGRGGLRSAPPFSRSASTPDIQILDSRASRPFPPMQSSSLESEAAAGETQHPVASPTDDHGTVLSPSRHTLVDIKPASASATPAPVSYGARHAHGRMTAADRSHTEAHLVPDSSYHQHTAGGHGKRMRATGWSGGRGRYDSMGVQPPILSPGSYNPHYAPRIHRTRSTPPSSLDELLASDVVRLLTDSVYVVVVLGYAALAFVIGALSFWAPVDFSKIIGISLSRSTQTIGLITFSCGLGGTFFGGAMLDWRGGGSKGIFAVVKALELSVAFTALSIVFALASVLTARLIPSMICLAFANFFLFGTSAPVNAALLSVAPRNMRSLAMAMSILLMHALGDLPSPFLMGWMTDELGSVQLALIILCLWLLWTVVFWASGVHLAKRRAEAFKKQLQADMAMPVHERTALLGATSAAPSSKQARLSRRGSTGDFSRQEFVEEMQSRPSQRRPYPGTDLRAYQPTPYSYTQSTNFNADVGHYAQPFSYTDGNVPSRRSRSRGATPSSNQRTPNPQHPSDPRPQQQQQSHQQHSSTTGSADDAAILPRPMSQPQAPQESQHQLQQHQSQEHHKARPSQPVQQATTPSPSPSSSSDSMLSPTRKFYPPASRAYS